MSLVTFSWVMGFSHIRLFMAGQKMTGQAEALVIRLTMSSQRPWETLAMMLAVAGAMSIRSARSVREMCWGSEESRRLKASVWTGRALRAWKVRGVMNFWESGVMTTVTPAPRWISLEQRSADL